MSFAVSSSAAFTSNRGDDARVFLESAFGRVPPGHYSLVWTLPDKKSRWYHGGDIERALADVSALDGHDVYIGAGLSATDRGERRRVDAAEVSGLVGLWADVDIADTAVHRKANLPATEEAARELIAAMGLPPTFIVHSGHGLQAWWIFKEPWIFENDEERDAAARLSVQWFGMMKVRAAERDCTIDATHDLSRIMRMPGTANLKATPVAVRLLEQDGPTYDPSDFEPWIADEAAMSLLTGRRTHHVGKLDLRADAQPNIVKRDVLAANDKSFDLTFNRKRKNLSDTSPSGYDMALASMAARVGWTDQEIVNLLIYARKTNGEDLKLNREDYYQRTIGNARAGLADQKPPEGARTARDTAPESDLAWDQPVPLGAERILPSFPVAALPAWMAPYVDALAIATQTPSDLAGILALSAASSCVARFVEVEVRAGWVEPLNLYTGTALLPGERKSGVFNAVVAPLMEVERDLVEAARPGVARALSQRRRLELRLKDAERKAAKDGGAGLETLADDLAQELDETPVPVLPRLFADDTTPEAMVSLLAEHGGRLGIFSAEGGIFDLLAGRYSKNDSGNLDGVLKAHAGDEIRVDRKSRPSEHIQRPALTIALAVQPEVLRSIAPRPGFRGRGLLGRFLYSVPVSRLGYRQIAAPSVPAPVAERYATSLAALARKFVARSEAPPVDSTRPRRPAEPTILHLSDEAAALFLAYEAEIEVRLQPGGDLRSISDWSAKLAGATIRIAGVLRLAGDMDDTTTPIDVATIESAIAIAKYFAEHALGAFELMGADPVVADAQHLLEWIKRNELSDFSRRDAHSGNRNRFPKAADLDPPLSLLQDHGWIRRREQGEPSRVGGRPRSPCFDVNPAAPQNSQNAQYPLLLEGFVGSADSVTVPGEESAEWTR